MPVCPDAFFQIEKNGNLFAYALEADRGTTTRHTFEDKINAYWRFLEQNRQIKAYGVKWFRVLTITLSEPRATNLAEHSSLSIPKKYSKSFLFTSFQNFQNMRL